MSYVILNKYGQVQPNVFIQGKAELTPVRLVLNGDPQDGGPNGPVNIAIQALLNQITYLRKEVKKLKNQNSDDLQRIKLQIAQSKPTDTSYAWIPSTDGEDIVDLDIKITLESGRVVTMLDSGIKCTVDDKVYTFVSSTAAIDYDDDDVLTFPGDFDMDFGGYYTLPADTTLPSTLNYVDTATTLSSSDSGTTDSDTTLPNSDSDTTAPVTVACGCDCEQANVSIAQINQSIDNFFNILEGSG